MKTQPRISQLPSRPAVLKRRARRMKITYEMTRNFIQAQQEGTAIVKDQLRNMRWFLRRHKKAMNRNTRRLLRSKIKALASYCLKLRRYQRTSWISRTTPPPQGANLS